MSGSDQYWLEQDWTGYGRAVSSGQGDFRIYHPKLVFLTGSMEMAVTLKQVEYWWNRMQRRPFYKFVAPCADVRYQAGQSWTEELAMSVDTWRRQIPRLAIKLSPCSGRYYRDPTHYVVYWTNHQRLTYWRLMENLYYHDLGVIHMAPANLIGQALRCVAGRKAYEKLLSQGNFPAMDQYQTLQPEMEAE